ncbi:MAG: hypothetical protein D6719_09370 [Candidatus Dadabacteria bacterium]|nr:MAG: hypothetical protein D6719_09370 [Candidatus Dadabacteria bacterium]
MGDKKNWFTRMGRLGEDDDKTAEYAAWDKLGNEERFRVAWELVVEAHKIKGRDLDELRFQRSVENIYRKKG